MYTIEQIRVIFQRFQSKAIIVKFKSEIEGFKISDTEPENLVVKPEIQIWNLEKGNKTKSYHNREGD